MLYSGLKQQYVREWAASANAVSSPEHYSALTKLLVKLQLTARLHRRWTFTFDLASLLSLLSEFYIYIFLHHCVSAVATFCLPCLLILIFTIIVISHSFIIYIYNLLHVLELYRKPDAHITYVYTYTLVMVYPGDADLKQRGQRSVWDCPTRRQNLDYRFQLL